LYLKHLSSLQFLTYVAFFAVVIGAIFRFLPGKTPPFRTRPYPDDELYAHDRRLAKYFVGGGFFLVLGSLHMVAKNLPWAAEWLARAGYAGHLVGDLSNTHVMIVGGGTLLSTGLCWYCLPRMVGRPLASEGLAQCAFWFTAGGLLVFYVALVGNGIAIGRLVEQGQEYRLAKAGMGDWYAVPIGVGAGIMGLGYWCFASNVALTIFQGRLVRIPRPHAHLAKFLATGAAGLTVGTVQGVVQVQPAIADWLYRAGHAGEWIDPISHAHVNLVTGLAMLVAGALFQLAPSFGGSAPTRRAASYCYFLLLGGSLAFYGTSLYLGFHEGALVVDGGLTPEQAEQATPLHPFLIMGSGIAMLAGFWLLLATVARSYRGARWPVRPFVLAGCAALAVGTLQGPVQAFPAVSELLDEGAEAGEVIVNLHAQLNMLGGLMVLLLGLALGLLGAEVRPRATRLALAGVVGGIAAYYAGGLVFSAIEAHEVAGGRTYGAVVASLEPWPALVLGPAALAVLVGFGAYASCAWSGTSADRAAGRRALADAPLAFSGRIPNRVRLRSPAAVAGYEVPMGLLGFPGVGWLFAGFPLAGSVLLMVGPALAWAVVPAAFTPYGSGPLRSTGWQAELVWLPATALLSTAVLYYTHRRRRRRLLPPQPRRRTGGGYRTRVGLAGGLIALVLVSLPFVAAVAGSAPSAVRYSYEPGPSRQVTGQFLVTPAGTVKLFSWRDPQGTSPPDALRVHASDVDSLVARAAAVDAPDAYQLFDLGSGRRIPLVSRPSTATTITLAPAVPLRPAHYVFLATRAGMFGGRDYAYLTVVPPAAAVTPINAAGGGRAPAVVHTLLPVAATIAALAFALLLALSFRRRPAGQKALWGVGFLLFAVATAAEAVAQRSGWSPTLFRAYYLSGGVLTVAYLGAGSAWLLLRPRGRDVLAGALVLATAAAAVAVALAPVDAAALAATASGRPPANGALGGHAFLWAVALNSFGTLFLVGGSLYSIARRRRVRVNVWIGGGALVLALATGLSRTGDYSLVYLGQLVGIALMFAGFTIVGRRPQPRPAAQPEPGFEKAALVS
jgi:cbb3-type cytochrome oxidase subunit 1